MLSERTSIRDAERAEEGDLVRFFLGNFPYSAWERELIDLCEPLGEVVRMHLPIWPDSGRRRGFVTVTIRLRRGLAAEQARQMLDKRVVPIPGRVGSSLRMRVAIAVDDRRDSSDVGGTNHVE